MNRLRRALNAFSERFSDHPALYAVMGFWHERQDRTEVYYRSKQA